MNKRLAFGFVLAAALIVAIIPLLSATEASTAEPQKQETKSDSKDMASIEEGGNVLYENATKDKTEIAAIPVAENETFRMFVEGKGLVYVVNKKNGKVWYSYPADRSRLKGSQKDLIENPVIIKYTQAGSAPAPTYPGKEEGKVTASEIDGGVRISYDLASIELKFAIEYRLTSDGMTLKVPFGLIQENVKNRLISLELLPYFDAAHATEQGYLFIPDGSGALINFKAAHLNYFDRYSQPVYGGDTAFTSQVLEQSAKIPAGYLYPSPKEKIALPVFGMQRGDQGYAAFITEGDHDARINASPSGYQNQDYYRSSVEFIYRNNDSIYIGDSGEVPLTQGRIIEGDRSVKYVLLEDEQVSYVGMAQVYRSYLTNERDIKPVSSSQPAFQLSLFGGVKRDEMIGSTFITMTTFKQAREIIDVFAGRGIQSIELTYEGWSIEGIYGKQPKHFPAERSLGGEKELKRLIAYAKSKGVSIYLTANYVKPFAENASFRPSKNAVRGIGREVMSLYDSHLATRQTILSREYYMIKPNYVIDKYLSKEIGEYTELGASGLKLDYVGDLLYSDQDLKNTFSRKQTMGAWTQLLDYTRSKVGHAAVDYGFAYTLGHVDRIDNAPTDSSHFVFEDETVPFYQLVVGGLVPMSGEPSNLRDDAVKDALRLIEYGVAPSYYLTYEDTSEIKRSLYAMLFSSVYKDWLDKAIAEFDGAKQLFQEIAGQPLIDHRKLEDHAYMSTYANGTQVIVNYSSSPITYENHTIEALRFALVKKGDGRE
ncbi:DUF5696 domain-containing protein [Paenibacillus mendelii]|uniref:DUF5696 domain-containing protein n=1 Tax=Paenibacillus mendelii TaxID=206163 RepID=A0ABV6JAT7_9BACL|nr:DUF5696 domain-containing protein [Paenibacillus mendelii]MCQ6563117.1 DUF5696 domain-containing protein [Paenibacillus mendelii]